MTRIGRISMDIKNDNSSTLRGFVPRSNNRFEGLQLPEGLVVLIILNDFSILQGHDNRKKLQEPLLYLLQRLPSNELCMEMTLGEHNVHHHNLLESRKHLTLFVIFEF